MLISHLTTMYPLPGNPHSGHAIYELVAALRNQGLNHEHAVEYYFSFISAKLLKGISKEHRIRTDALRQDPWEENLNLRSIPILPKDKFARWINPLWQRHVLPRKISRLGCDLVHVHMCQHLSYGAALGAKKHGLPIVLTLRREVDFSLVQPWRRRLLAEAIRMADVVVTPSVHLAQKCLDETGVKAEVIPSGTNPIFDEKAPDKMKPNKRILFVGTLDANKGGRLVVETSIRLYDEGKDFELYIAGDDLIGETPQRARLEAMAEKYPGIKFLGNLSPMEVREQMRQAQLLCIPSYTETLGLVYLEAMKQSLAVIGRQGTGIDGMGRAGRDYELIDSDDQLYDLLSELVDDEDRCRRLGENGRHLVGEWTWENAAARHNEIYESLVGSKD